MLSKRQSTRSAPSSPRTTSLRTPETPSINSHRRSTCTAGFSEALTPALEGIPSNAEEAGSLAQSARWRQGDPDARRPRQGARAAALPPAGQLPQPDCGLALPHGGKPSAGLAGGGGQAGRRSPQRGPAKPHRRTGSLPEQPHNSARSFRGARSPRTGHRAGCAAAGSSRGRRGARSSRRRDAAVSCSPAVRPAPAPPPRARAPRTCAPRPARSPHLRPRPRAPAPPRTCAALPGRPPALLRSLAPRSSLLAQRLRSRASCRSGRCFCSNGACPPPKSF